MARTTMNLQDSFLNQVRKDNTEIKMVLFDGANLTGRVRGFDNFTVILSVGEEQHLIYKHAIAQIISPRFSTRREDPRDATGRHGGSPHSRARESSRDHRSKDEKFNTLNLSNVVAGKEEVKS